MGMVKVYHGSTLTVSHPLAKVGRENLDFGQGFYVTDIREQAERWAFRLGRQQQKDSLLNIYMLDLDAAKRDFSVRVFPDYDQEWLEFIVASRRGLAPWKSYDMVEGGVANDRVIDTIEAYMDGMMTVEMALERLALHRPNNQFCLLNQRLINECLQFVSVEPVNSI